MNSTILLLGGVPFYGGEGLFRLFLVTLGKRLKTRKNEILMASV
jgi:hypothetical protein